MSQPKEQQQQHTPIITGADGTATPTSGRRKIRSESTNHPPEEQTTVQSSFAAVSDDALFSVHFGVASEQGIRKTMEDQHTAVTQAIPFFGVYDGHGGTQCAEFLKEHLHTFVLSHPKLKSEPETALRESIARAETEFMEKCRTERIESGSTAALAILLDHNLVTANVGDSEIVLCRGGQPVLLTTKHQLNGNEKEVERVKNCGGRIYHNRVGHPKFNPQLVSLAISRAIGDAGFKLDEYTDGKSSGIIADAETQTTRLTEADEFFIIACDGLYDVMSYQECVDLCRSLVQNGESCQNVSQTLVAEALQRGSTDNVTVLFVLLQNGVPSPASKSADTPAVASPA